MYSHTKFYKFQAFNKEGTLLADSFEDHNKKFSSIRKLRSAATSFKKVFNKQYTDTKITAFEYYEVSDHMLILSY